MDGKAFDLNSVKGHVVLVDFWASWCVPCVQQMRGLAKLADDFSKQGLIVVGVDWGDDDPNAAREFLKKNHYRWTNLQGDSATVAAWMLNGVPLVAVIDPEGNIAYYHTGYEQPEETSIVDVLRKINPIFKTEAVPCQRPPETH
jgi:thiol-disulfide isomerase/thioredoxin